jgi:hypothetical protein
VSSSNGRQLRNQGDGHGGEKSSLPGQGRYCYFATLPISLDTSLGDGYDTRISFQLEGAHMGVVKKQLQKAEQQQSLYQSLVDGTVLDVTKLFQIVESALDRSKITISGPRLIGQVERQSGVHQGRTDAETHLVSFYKILVSISLRIVVVEVFANFIGDEEYLVLRKFIFSREFDLGKSLTFRTC